jgi:hypothetical protein
MDLEHPGHGRSSMDLQGDFWHRRQRNAARTNGGKSSVTSPSMRKVSPGNGRVRSVRD